MWEWMIEVCGWWSKNLIKVGDGMGKMNVLKCNDVKVEEKG